MDNYPKLVKSESGMMRRSSYISNSSMG